MPFSVRIFLKTVNWYNVRHVHTISFSVKNYIELFKNEFFRYTPNPPITSYVLLQRDARFPYVAQALQFSFEEFNAYKKSIEKEIQHSQECHTLRIQGGGSTKCEISDSEKIDLPHIEKLIDLQGLESSFGDVKLYARTPHGISMNGQPHCVVDLTPKVGVSQQYMFYSFSPHKHNKNDPIHIPRFFCSEEAKRLQREKGGRYKSSDELVIYKADVEKRSNIAKRDPDQNTVMGHRAVDEYRQCAKEYENYLFPLLKLLLLTSANVMHLSTLRAKLERNEAITQEEIDRAYRDRFFRTEWLHLLAFGLHPMNQNPQKTSNLAAAMACDNTRMLLIERALKWFALHVLESKNRLKGRFDLLLDTNVIDKITLQAFFIINGIQLKLNQEIDALTYHPKCISASDLAGLVMLMAMLIQGVKPISVTPVKIQSTAPVVLPSSSSHFSL